MLLALEALVAYPEVPVVLQALEALAVYLEVPVVHHPSVALVALVAWAACLVVLQVCLYLRPSFSLLRITKCNLAIVV